MVRVTYTTHASIDTVNEWSGAMPCPAGWPWPTRAFPTTPSTSTCATSRTGTSRWLTGACRPVSVWVGWRGVAMVMGGGCSKHMSPQLLPFILSSLPTLPTPIAPTTHPPFSPITATLTLPYTCHPNYSLTLFLSHRPQPTSMASFMLIPSTSSPPWSAPSQTPPRCSSQRTTPGRGG